MKGLIMAGGEGTRIRPVTCSKPKPMLDVMGRPIMEYIIELLKKHGIAEIAVTLQYMPQAIMDHFGDGSDYGVRLEYFVEQTPLGTAGSVKNAQDFFDDDFIIISGDCLTDIDLTAAIDFHKKKSSVATLVLSQVENPLEYGVVVTNSDGYITRFLEKPGWSEVFSDTVNTGIYIINPEILDLFGKGERFDFSKDLFPKLLERKQPMFGYVDTGYWCDIGDLKAYMQCHKDILDKNIKLCLDLSPDAKGLYISDSAVIEPNTMILPPVYIGDGARIVSGAKIMPYSIIGKNCRVLEGASLKQSILHSGVTLNKQSQVRGSILCDFVSLGAFSSVYEDSIIGEHTTIEDMCEVKSGIKIWPQKLLSSGTLLNENLVWGSSFSRKLFGERGIVGEINVDITPEYATKLGATFGGLMKGGKIGIGYGDGVPLVMLKNAFVAGLISAGSQVFDFNVQTLPVTRSGVPFYGLDGGVHLSVTGCVDDICNLRISFIDSFGADLPREAERKLETLFSRDDFARCEMTDMKNVTELNNYNLYYLREIISSAGTLKKDLSIALGSDSALAFSLAHTLLKQADAEILPVENNHSVITSIIDETGEHVSFYDENGMLIPDEQYLAIVARIALDSRRANRIVMPISYPGTIDQLASKYNGSVIKCKTNSQDFMRTMLDNNLLYQFKMIYDPNFAILSVCDYLQKNQMSLSELADEIPAYHIHEQEVECGFAHKGRVIRTLSQDEPEGKVDLSEGVKIIKNKGWVLVIPHKDKAVCRIIAEGATEEYASELTGLYADKIKKIVSAKNKAVQKQ